MIVLRNQGDEVWVGEDGDFPHPLGVYPPSMPLDWVLDRDKGEDPSLAIFDAIEQDFLRKVKVVRLKTKGWRKLRNLKKFH
jgi:hypothetical protein